MIPNRRWFPLSLQERAAWYLNFNNQIQSIGAGLGLTATELLAVDKDNANIQFLAGAAVQLEAYAAAVRQYRLIFTEGAIGEATPAFPADFSLAPPDPSAPTGAFERLDKLVRRIRVAPSYTAQTGALLGILPTTGEQPGEADLKPLIKTSESFNGYKFSVNVTRLGMTAFKIQFARADEQNGWHDIAFATNNPVEVTVPPLADRQPERILVRAVLLQKNEPVGRPSDPTYVTINP
jgi:hypothetical protein